MSEDIRVLPSGKGFESKYGNYNITITPNMIEQLQKGKVLHMDIDEYSVVLKLGNEVKYEITFGDDSFDDIVQILAGYTRSCSAELRPRLSEFITNLGLGYYGLVLEKLDILREVRVFAKDNKEVLSAIDYILERFSDVEN